MINSSFPIMDMKMNNTSLPTDFETILNPLRSIQVCSSLVGGVKSMQIVVLYSSTFWRTSVVFDWRGTSL